MYCFFPLKTIQLLYALKLVPGVYRATFTYTGSYNIRIPCKQRILAIYRGYLSEYQHRLFIMHSSVLQLFGLHASLKCNFPSHKLCIFLYFSRFLPRSVPVTLLLSPKFPFWGDQNSHFDNNSPSLPLIGGIRFRIWGKNHPPKIQISNGS